MGCQEENGYRQYEKLVEEELESGRRFDSLFFDFHFGITAKEFYSICWEMNKKGLFFDGENNTAVLYKMTKELPHPASMNFYPNFHEGKIFKMGVSFHYDGWAPWNKHLFADSLQQDVLHLYERWYPEGNPFIKIQDEDRGTIYIKVDGNRRIIIGKYDESYVKVDYTNLLIEKPTKN